MPQICHVAIAWDCIIKNHDKANSHREILGMDMNYEF